MRRLAFLCRQRGATLVVGLIMLVLITLLVTSAFMLSNTNSKSVGNMQIRNEAIAAANKAAEQVISSPFTTAPTAESIEVDLNNDGTTDYTVDFAAPVCVSETQMAGKPAKLSSSALHLPTTLSDFYQTVWDLDANVTDNASGTMVRVRQGVRVLLTKAQYNAVCDT